MDNKLDAIYRLPDAENSLRREYESSTVYDERARFVCSIVNAMTQGVSYEDLTTMSEQELRLWKELQDKLDTDGLYQKCEEHPKVLELLIKRLQWIHQRIEINQQLQES